MKKLQNNFTTPEQSGRLLELGVPANSADCYYTEDDIEGNMYWFEINVKREYQPHSCLHASLIWGRTLPCWSAVRLMEIFDICYVGKREDDEWPKINEMSSEAGSVVNYIIGIYEIALKENGLDFSKLEEWL